MGVVLRAAIAAALLMFTTMATLADDWVAVRLRGAVLQLIDGEWQKLSRGDVVPDSRVIRTLTGGNVEFQRGEERVTLGANTQIQIYDEVRARPFTTVKQYFGTVTVEAEVQDVQHFAVQTRYLAAVVKGTKFTVTSGDDGASVAVARGSVFVESTATKNDVTIAAGQSAAVGADDGAPVVADQPVGLSALIGSLGKAKTEDEDSADDKPGKGKPEITDDKSGKGKNDDEESGKGKSGDDDEDNGKSGKGKSGDNSGKGKNNGDDDD